MENTERQIQQVFSYSPDNQNTFDYTSYFRWLHDPEGNRNPRTQVLTLAGDDRVYAADIPEDATVDEGWEILARLNCALTFERFIKLKIHQEEWFGRMEYLRGHSIPYKIKNEDGVGFKHAFYVDNSGPIVTRVEFGDGVSIEDGEEVLAAGALHAIRLAHLNEVECHFQIRKFKSGKQDRFFVQVDAGDAGEGKRKYYLYGISGGIPLLIKPSKLNLREDVTRDAAEAIIYRALQTIDSAEQNHALIALALGKTLDGIGEVTMVPSIQAHEVLETADRGRGMDGMQVRSLVNISYEWPFVQEDIGEREMTPFRDTFFREIFIPMLCHAVDVANHISFFDGNEVRLRELYDATVMAIADRMQKALDLTGDNIRSENYRIKREKCICIARMITSPVWQYYFHDTWLRDPLTNKLSD